MQCTRIVLGLPGANMLDRAERATSTEIFGRGDTHKEGSVDGVV